MAMFFFRWRCPYCDAAKQGLSDSTPEEAGMSALNTHLRKLADDIHGEYETYPDGWDAEDARAWVTVSGVTGPAGDTPRS